MKVGFKTAIGCLLLLILVFLFIPAYCFSQDVPKPTIMCQATLEAWKNDPSMREYLATHTCDCSNGQDAEPVCRENQVQESAGTHSGSSAVNQGHGEIHGTTNPIDTNIGGRIKQKTSTNVSFDGDSTDISGRIKRRAAIRYDEIAQISAELGKMNPPVTIPRVKADIALRQVEPDPMCQVLAESLKSKVPPPLTKVRFPLLQPGDVLLIAPERALTFGMWTGFYIKLFDKLSSMEWQSRASHTCIFVKEVKGVKFFLDNLPGEGPRIKGEDQIIKEYGARSMDVARPVNKLDSKKIWDAARELGIKQINADLKKLDDSELVRRMNTWTNYGLYGDDNMVCSEADRWALIQAGLEIANTDSPFKKLAGIYFGPANFYSDSQNFLVLPLEKLPKADDTR